MRPSKLSRRKVLIAAASLLAGPTLLGCRKRGEPAKTPPSPAKPASKTPRPLPEPSAAWTQSVDRLHASLARDDYRGAADAASHLTNEAFLRADRVVEAWMPKRIRGLFPRKLTSRTPDDQLWSYRDCAADFYCHVVIEGLLLAPEHLPELRDVLARERAITTGVPSALRLDTGQLAPDDDGIFGASEYVKDGLLSILERVGPTEWLDRMHEVLESVLGALPIETRYGRIASRDCETNGDLLQVLSRLWHREHRPEYLAAGRAITDAYVKELLPANGWLPPIIWDFEKNRAKDPGSWLLDHGNEMIPGLVEWTIAETVAPDSRHAAYAPAVEHMLDALLEYGRDSAGMWGREIVAGQRHAPEPPAQPENDTWGYLSAAYVAYALTLRPGDARRERYLAEARRAFEAATKYRHARWQGGHFDGYADSIEGALYLLPHFDEPAFARWIDEQAGVFLAYQRDDGFVTAGYLDGNFVRTSLLYGLFRTGGTRVVPWRPGVRLGAVRSPEGLHIALSSDSPLRTRLVFDRMRHREYLNLPFDYPRLNGWTEWFPIDPALRYEVTSSKAGGAPRVRTHGGNELLDGIPIDVGNDVVHVRVRRAS